MPKRTKRWFRCTADICVHAITCPGVYLARRNDVYLTMCLFGQIRRTRLCSPCFPLNFHEKFVFDKVFCSADHPTHVADSLEDYPVGIELVQCTEGFEGGKLLAYYECSARDFLYPYPSYSFSYGTQDREILLERSLDFPGLCPRLEFSTKTDICEINSSSLADDDNDVIYVPRGRPRSSRSKTRHKNKGSAIAHGRPTVSSISRTRSLSPGVRKRMDELSLDTTKERPPFVVRRVESKLTARQPGKPSPKQKAIECNHGTYNGPHRYAKAGEDTSHYNYKAITNGGSKRMDVYTSRVQPSRNVTDYLDLQTNRTRPYSRLSASPSDDDVIYVKGEIDSDLLDLTTQGSRCNSPNLSYGRTPSPRYRRPGSRPKSPGPAYRSASPYGVSGANGYRTTPNAWGSLSPDIPSYRANQAALDRSRAVKDRSLRLFSNNVTGTPRKRSRSPRKRRRINVSSWTNMWKKRGELHRANFNKMLECVYKDLYDSYRNKEDYIIS